MSSENSDLQENYMPLDSVKLYWIVTGHNCHIATWNQYTFVITFAYTFEVYFTLPSFTLAACSCAKIVRKTLLILFFLMQYVIVAFKATDYIYYSLHIKQYMKRMSIKMCYYALLLSGNTSIYIIRSSTNCTGVVLYLIINCILGNLDQFACECKINVLKRRPFQQQLVLV